MLHYIPQHVSSSTLLIIRRTNCITTASGTVTLSKQPYSMRVESGPLSIRILYGNVAPCATLPLSEPLPTTTTGHYTICCKFLVLRSWRWAKDCPKHVEVILEISKLLLLHLVGYTGCFKKSFTTLKAYRNLYRGHTQGFELSKCSNFYKLSKL